MISAKPICVLIVVLCPACGELVWPAPVDAQLMQTVYEPHLRIAGEPMAGGIADWLGFSVAWAGDVTKPVGTRR